MEQWPNSKQALEHCLRQVPEELADKLRREWHKLQKSRQRGQMSEHAVAQWQKRFEMAAGLQSRKLSLWPKDIAFPEALPVCQRLNDISALLSEHQVIIVAGETGSGKTTQLPKMCMQQGRGQRALIGHTQPRRLAARSVASRLSEELGPTGEQLVGYKIRFDDKVPETAAVAVMTDGVLLAELKSDPLLKRYDTLIIDEAHERSLNIDFILGYLKRLLPKRPDLKVIVTSATIETEKFSRHFGGAPVIEVSGRTYPVDIRYRPLTEPDEDVAREPIDGILLAVDELDREGPGDILVFLPGEREIRDTATALRQHYGPSREVLPLYARLSKAEQQRIFRPSNGRRIVLATNVAETSLTVPGIRYVIDTGLVRINRYSRRNKIARLPVEPVSQASANQRAGRCGRVASGICIRLYSEDDFASRPEFTDPEIKRVHLASVILKMLDLGLKDVERFPFLEPPERRDWRDGYRLLAMLNAIDQHGRLTRVGRWMAQLPLDPRLAAIIIAARQRHCLKEAAVICAGLSVVDPRERPFEKRQRADELHRRFDTEASDFWSWVNLWNYVHDLKQTLSGSQLRKQLKKEMLSWLRMRDWWETFRQIMDICRRLGWRANEQPGDYENLHKALLVGFPDRVGQKTAEGDYQGARHMRFKLIRSSAIFARLPQEKKRNPKWVVAGEIIETRSIFASIAAVIDPKWTIDVVPHLLKTTYFDAFWSKRRGMAMIERQRSLFGLIVEGRHPVPLDETDKKTARALLIREGLMARQWQTRSRAILACWKAIDQVKEEEAMARRRDRLVDDDVLFELWNARVPTSITRMPQLEKWLRRQSPQALNDWIFKPEELRRSEQDTPVAMPKFWKMGAIELPLSYCFEPGSEHDGVTVTVPVRLVGDLDAKQFDWMVPSLTHEKVTALIKTLPKNLRRNFVPAPDFARAALERMDRSGELLTELCLALTKMTGIELTPDDFEVTALPAHLRMRFRIVDEQGKVLAEGRDFDRLLKSLDTDIKMPESAPTARPVECWPHWPAGFRVPQKVCRTESGIRIQQFLALAPVSKDERRPWRADAVAVTDIADERQAAYVHYQGCVWLAWRQLADVVDWYLQQLPEKRQRQTLCKPWGSLHDLVAGLLWRQIGQTFGFDGQWIDEPTIETWVKTLRPEIYERLDGAVQHAFSIMQDAAEIRKTLKRQKSPVALASYADIDAALNRWLGELFWMDASEHRWRSLPRYLRALKLRLEKLPHSATKERAVIEIVQKWEHSIDALAETVMPWVSERSAWQQLSDAVDELRVSLLTQEIGTAFPVSEKRLRKQWRESGLPLTHMP